MTEKARLENQKHCIDLCRREGWLDAENRQLWPDDPEARAAMGRALFGLSFTNNLDTIFTTWRERALNLEGRTMATPGSIVDLKEKAWGAGLAAMTQEQRDFVLRIIDDVLASIAYSFPIMLDRFDHGKLTINLTPHARDDDDDDDDDETSKPAEAPLPPIQIHPHGFLEMFQEALEWREKFGRGAAIGRPVAG